jgi:hypothetical protein
MSHPLAGVLGAPKVKLAFLVQLAFVVFKQYLTEALDGPLWSAQVVRNRVAEDLQLAVEGLELGRAPPDASLQLFIEPAELFLCSLALGNVTDHHADDLPTAVGNHVRADLHVDQVLKVYTLSGFLAGLAGIIDVARFNTASVGAHTLDNLAAISAAVIGGTSLFGGIVGSVVGTFIPAVLRNGFVIHGVQPFWQEVAIGIVLILAVLIDQRRRSAEERM